MTRPSNIIPINEAAQVRTQCVLLAVVAVVSFRSIPRILSILRPDQWKPHFTSTINWTLRFGLSLLRGVERVDTPWVAIVDETIDVAVQKALVVLRVPLSALATRGSAITLEDAQCIGISVADTWNGETVSEYLQQLFLRVGFPVAVVKDGGSDLERGVKLLNATTQAPIAAIEDVGHFAANALKAEYKLLLKFQKFLKLVCKIGAKLRQSELAFLTPPKLRTKGRFQNISKLAKWTASLLLLVSSSGRLKADSLGAKLRGFIPGLAGYRVFLEGFSNTCHLVNSFLALMKNKGFNQETYNLARTQLEQLPVESLVRTRLFAWLDRQLKIYTSLKIGDTPLVVSSDIIESLFGKFKILVARNPSAEFNRIVLSIATLCGKVTPESIDLALKQVTQSDLNEWTKENVEATQCKLRLAFNQGKLRPDTVLKAGKIILQETG